MKIAIRRGHQYTGRDGAGTNYLKLGTMANGIIVKIDKRYSKPGWYSIYYGDHGGFVSSDYIKLVYEK